jgi:hypothetical protein
MKEWINQPGLQYNEIVSLIWMLADMQGNLAHMVRDGLRNEGRESAAEWADDLVDQAEQNVGASVERIAKVLSNDALYDTQEHLRAIYEEWRTDDT